MNTTSEPTQAKSCPECGQVLLPDAPQGLCPRCLMKNAALAGEPSAVESGGTTAYVSGREAGASVVAMSPPAGFVAPEIAELAGLLPQLEVIEMLGQGGMGVVYRVRQRGLDREAALKIMPPRASGDSAFSERFGREARALARLNHPNIITVYDFGCAGDLYYFLMEYVDGANLRQLLRAGRIWPRQALSIVPQICDALQYAHDEGVVHRDIKPENILIDGKGRVKIADFGLVKLLVQKETDPMLTGPRHVMGTVHYMAPEQIERPLEVDHRADIYSLGVVFYELLTGELPLGRFSLPSEKVQMDVRLDEVVLKTLEKDPRRRYQHASEVKSDVEMASAGNQWGPAGQPRRRVFLAYAALLAAALVLAGGAWLLLEGDRAPSKAADTELESALEKLLDPEVLFDEKEEILEDLRRTGRLESIIAVLERKALEVPESADRHLALGVAYIKKVTSAGNDLDKGTYARKADQAFDRALALDARHWGARFYKAISLTFWPPVFGKMAEAIRHFELLLEQQAEGPSRPEHAETYLFLGNVHQQQGNYLKALEVWRKGAALFPGHPGLGERLEGAPPESP
jgi:tetratricopeptide (TPR) repeat protein/predicted Ser/Thr protein kinase